MKYRTCSKCGKEFLGDSDDCGCQSAVQLNGNQTDATKTNKGGFGSCLLSIIIFLSVIIIGSTIGSIIGGAFRGLVKTPTVEDLTTKIGDKVPNISWTMLNGEKIELNQFKGSWVLLCYWCPCDKHGADILAIKSLYNDVWHGQIKVLIINAPDSLKSDTSLEEFANVNHMPVEFKLISYKQDDIASKISRPQYFLITPSGILYKYRGDSFSYDYRDLDEKGTLDNVVEFTSDAILNISNVIVSNITDKSAELYWETDKEATSFATLSPSRIKNLSLMCPIYSDNNFTKIHTFSLSNLEPGGYYSVHLRSTGALGMFDTYDLGFQTQPSVYADETKISNISIYDITDKSAKIRWSTDRSVGCWLCSRAKCFDVDKPTTEHSYTLSKLAPEKEHWVQIECEAGVMSDVFNFKTVEAIDKARVK